MPPETSSNAREEAANLAYFCASEMADADGWKLPAGGIGGIWNVGTAGAAAAAAVACVGAAGLPAAGYGACVPPARAVSWLAGPGCCVLLLLPKPG